MSDNNFNYLHKPMMVYSEGKFDPFVTRLSEWIKQEIEPTVHYDMALIGVPLSRSSITLSNAFAHPQQFRQLWSNFTTYNFEEDIDLVNMKVTDLGDVKMHVTDVLQCHNNIEEAAYEVSGKLPHTLPVHIGGDHSITYPIIKGMKRSKNNRIGLIQFDAHLDVRDVEYGGPSNGTPIRSLMEKDIVQGEDIVTIGLRSFANSKIYRDYAEEKGMTLFTAKQVREQGMEEVIKWSMDYLNEKCDQVYVTFDIDVMDQSYVPAVPAIGPDGLTSRDIFYSALTLGQWDKVAGIDLVCVDPSRDVRDVTSRVALHIFLHFASGRRMLLGE